MTIDPLLWVIAVGVGLLFALQLLRALAAVGDYRLRRRVVLRGPVSRPAPDPLQRWLAQEKE